MIKYDDLLTAEYKPHGRGDGGYDCYGLVLECCRRAGTPLKDPFRKYESMEAGAEIPYINDFNNIREIKRPKAGAVAECASGRNLHVGYMVAPDKVLHITRRGARVTHIKAVNAVRFYEVVENESEHD